MSEKKNNLNFVSYGKKIWIGQKHAPTPLKVKWSVSYKHADKIITKFSQNPFNK